MTERVYYEVIPGTPEHDFCESLAQGRKAKKKEFADFSQSKGARGWTEGWGSINGLIFDPGVEIPEGLRKDKRKTNDGHDRWIPAVRTLAGKAFQSELEAIGYLPNDDKFCKQFEIPTSMSYHNQDGTLRGSMRFVSCGFMNTCGVCWAKEGEYWIVLPDIAAEIEDVKRQGYKPDIPDLVIPSGLTLSSRARFDLAIAKARVEEEENAGS